MHLSRYTSFFFGATYWLIYKIRFLHNGNSPFPGILWLCWYVFNYCFFWNSKELVWYDSEKSFQAALVVKNACQGRRHGFDPWVRKIAWRRKWQPTPLFLPGIPWILKNKRKWLYWEENFSFSNLAPAVGSLHVIGKRHIKKNFQTFKLDLEKAEEPEIKLPTSTGSYKKQESSRKTSTSASLTMPKPLTMWFTTNYGKFLKRWEYQTILPASWEICMLVKKQQLELDMEQQTGSKLGKE